ncbi:hypothetical protein FEM48_Zijuj08G0145600 [Ziziphus jujuba var. spinosa]|uniref:Very-long-chain (3R)-3-hydroxyacyl-CoA dehydratase n=1 Tax=Ziziphus jujuba var. spinosa TaxID=714518 RepID=A0A978UZN8_ZIZJJ|nr:hypothetical protein FEM48_Zijuj08G0145600 [Ziziphus jujuba var. spinosa]
MIMHFSWSLALYLALKTLKETGYGHVYKSVEKPLQLAQSAAVLEEQILHSLVGKSSILHESGQIPNNSNAATDSWQTVYYLGDLMEFSWANYQQTQTHILVSTLVFSWSITEVVRYSFFGTKEALGFAPSWLLWLRYSTFFLLHPIGVTSEIGLIYIALPDIKESEKYSIKMPNKWNFSFYFFYAAIFTIGIFSIGMNMDYSFLHVSGSFHSIMATSLEIVSAEVEFLAV